MKQTNTEEERNKQASSASQQGENPRKTRKKAPRSSVVEYLAGIDRKVMWYYDVRIWLPILLLLLLIFWPHPKQQDNSASISNSTTTQESLPQAETEPPTEAEEPLIAEAVALAKLADSVGVGRSDNVKTIIMWVAINRSEDRANGYGLSLEEEIARENQWQGYDPNTPYYKGTYEIAKKVLETKLTGGLRPLDEDMLWFVLNDDGSITVRNQFTSKQNQKWREKTIQ